MRINFIRECINNRIIELHFVPTDKNVADLLTKALGFGIFTRHSDILLHGFNGKLDIKEEAHFVFSCRDPFFAPSGLA